MMSLTTGSCNPKDATGECWNTHRRLTPPTGRDSWPGWCHCTIRDYGYSRTFRRLLLPAWWKQPFCL